MAFVFRFFSLFSFARRIIITVRCFDHYYALEHHLELLENAESVLHGPFFFLSHFIDYIQIYADCKFSMTQIQIKVKERENYGQLYCCHRFEKPLSFNHIFDRIKSNLCFFSLDICENALYSVRYENILNLPHADEGLSRVWHCYITVLVSASIETHRSA